jgi:hypothetical protein
VSYPTPLRTAGDKFAVLMAAASRGVDALRDEIVDMAKKKEVDDALMAILTGNAANAEAEGDEGRAKFLYKVAEVCLREKKKRGFGPFFGRRVMRRNACRRLFEDFFYKGAGAFSNALFARLKTHRVWVEPLPLKADVCMCRCFVGRARAIARECILL